MRIRPIISLWTLSWRYALPFAWFVFLFFSTKHEILYFAAALSFPVAWTARVTWRRRWLWRFAMQVRTFRTVHRGRVTLHYDPILSKEWDFLVIAQLCELEYERIAEKFSASSPRRAVIYLFAERQEITKIMGPEYGGVALYPNVIVVGYDTPLKDAIRHEFAHLFSLRWNRFAPPLMSEGLSVWLQGTTWGYPLDLYTRPLVDDPTLKPTKLVDRRSFFERQHRYKSYIVAGSFTGYLVRNFGWERYQSFYRSSRANNFLVDFKKFFGTSLEDVESQWRREVILTETLIRRVKTTLN